jgi:hypothetical protein
MSKSVTIWLGWLTMSASLFLALLFFTAISKAQTRNSGIVVGIVTDSLGAGVAGADVELLNSETAVSVKTKTAAQGNYSFASVPPGTYMIVVIASGFSRTVVPVEVNVAKSIQQNITLQVGKVTETVDVKARAIELQTTDSSVGEVIESKELERLPTTQRRVTELAYLQPATAPLTGSGSASIAGDLAALGGGIAGARPDQNTATLDGVIVTDQTNGGYGSGFGGNIATFPLPVDAVEEFRGTVSNADSSRSSGGQFNFATRRGTNYWHGTAYWYLQNDNANANDWTSNFYGIPRAELKDNRVGGRIGGPIWKDKTFFSFFYEARRYPNFVSGGRTGIGETLRTGVLRFRDASGNVVSYNLNPANGPISSLCGSGVSCDPRGIGFNPVIQDYFKLYPVANVPTGGDGLNTAGIQGPVSDSQVDDTALVRLDHNLNNKWRLTGTYMWQGHTLDDTRQQDFNPSVTKGALLKSIDTRDLKPQLATAGTTAQLSPNLTFDVRLGWVRQDLNTRRVLPQTLVAAAGSPLQLSGNNVPRLLDNPGDPIANRARPQIYNQDSRSINSSLSWLHGNHLFNTSFHMQLLSVFHSRFDRTSLLETPVAQIRTGRSFILPADNRPPRCDDTITTDCLRSADVSRWNTLYGVLLGIWDNTQSFDRRDANGDPAGFGPVSTTMNWKHFDIAAADTWRIKPSLTLSYGVTLKIETPLSEENGKQDLLMNADSGALIDPRAEIKAKLTAASQGDVFNQTYAYVPAQKLRRSIYPTIVVPSPHAALAWNPSFNGGLFGKLLGNRKTVLRGGYSLIWDSMQTATLQGGAMNGNQLIGSSFSVNAPTCDAAGSPGPNCSPGVSPFRVGVDGKPFVPTPSVLPIPYIPSAATATNRTFGVPGAFASSIDPNLTTGHLHDANFTLQRDLPGGFFVEVGWIGKYARNLTVTLNDTAPPVNIKDLSHKSNQTFAQAFDKVATQLRGGADPSTVAAQPWFENLYGPGGTVRLAGADPNDFISGSLTPLFQQTFPGNIPGIDAQLLTTGLPPIDNQQFGGLMWYTNGAWANYNAMFVTFRSRAWHGLTSNFNYTWSHCLDVGSTNESEANTMPNSYDIGYNYGDCWTDARHTINLYGVYTFPSPQRLRRLLGGWDMSYIATWHSGNPLAIVNTIDEFGQMNSGELTENVVSINPGADTRTGVISGITGSNGIGTNSDPSQGGTGLNLFRNPEQVFNSVRPPLISQDTRTGRGAFRGLGYFGLDFSVGKEIVITEKLKAHISVDAFNVLNYVNFGTPFLSIQDPANFGVISGQVVPDGINGDTNVGPRRLQAGLRFEF